MSLNQKTHLSPHHRHLSLEHGFVKALIRLKYNKMPCVSRFPVTIIKHVHYTVLSEYSH